MPGLHIPGIFTTIRKIAGSSYKRSKSLSGALFPSGPDARRAFQPVPEVPSFAVCHQMSIQHHLGCLPVGVPSFTSGDRDGGSAARVSLHELLSGRHYIGLVIGERAIAQPLPILCHGFTGSLSTDISTLGILY